MIDTTEMTTLLQSLLLLSAGLAAQQPTCDPVVPLSAAGESIWARNVTPLETRVAERSGAQAGGVMAAADQLFREERWQDAARAYETALDAAGDRGFVWFRLGLVYRQLGDLARSADAFERAAEISRFTDPNAVRMLAQTAVEAGDEDAAYRWLERLVEMGMTPGVLESRPEYAPLRSHDRFRELVRLAGRRDGACESAEHRQFDFWLGEWDVVTHHGMDGAVDVVTTGLNGCVIEERYTGFTGSVGRSVSLYDRRRQEWRQIWFADDGSVNEHAGGLVDGAMVLVGEVVGPDGARVLDRMTWTPLEDGSVLQVVDNSDDGGATWSTLFELAYRRRAAAAP